MSPDGEPDGRNPYVFVVGCPRSGTTLLQRMLDSHPALAVANDTQFIVGALPGLAPGFDPPLTPELVERVRNDGRFDRLGLSDEVVRGAAEASRTFRQLAIALYSRLAALQGKPLAGEKSPEYVLHLPLLASLFPWARTVHVIRDGRDVALSARGWARPHRGPGLLDLWREEPTGACALWWRHLVWSGRRDGRRLGPAHYSEVRYEDLVEQPEERLSELSTFLELECSAEMARCFVGPGRPETNGSRKNGWLPPTPGLRDWRAQMRARDVALFEAIAGGLLSELGYSRAFETISPAVVRVAKRCEAWWEDQMERKRLKEATARVMAFA